MAFDTPEACATTLAIVSIIGGLAEDYAGEQDMDSYWTCLAIIRRISEKTGHCSFSSLTRELRDRAHQRALELLDATPGAFVRTYGFPQEDNDP
jgi:hypothetical protein